MVRRRTLIPVFVGSNPTRAVAEITKRMNKVSGLEKESEKTKRTERKVNAKNFKRTF